jgi:hypothetical protein
MSTIFSDVTVVNGVTFNDPLLRPAGTGFWNIDELDGWDRTPEIDFQTSAIGGSIDGEEIATDSPALGRHLVIGGYVSADDRLSAEAAKDVLWRDAFPRGPVIRITRNEPIPKFIDARVSSRREFVMVGPQMYRWMVPMVAGDPFKYAATALSDSTGAAGQSTGGRTYPRRYPMTYGTVAAGEGNALVLVNAGNIASRNLVITLTGPLTNGSWRISNETTSEELAFAVDVSSTDSLAIDFRAGVATLNGYPIGSSIIGDFFKLVTGENILKLFADYDPAVSISAVGYSAWE